MPTISINYALVWEFKEYSHIKVTRCRKLFNTIRGTQLKQTINGGSIGYWISSDKFIPTSKINSYVKLIQKQNCPF